MAREI
ncbi:hypothetical protein HU200_030685 [Digitaria exilis]